MTNILMVCLGNICRSPLAEGILASKLPNTSYQVASAGTAGYHIGASPDPRSIAVARKHGLDISKQRGRQFEVSDFDSYDYIFVMDQSNFENIVTLARNPEDISKVSLILNQRYPNANIEVPDPYYGGDTGFEDVYQMLDSACDIFVKKLS